MRAAQKAAPFGAKYSRDQIGHEPIMRLRTMKRGAPASKTQRGAALVYSAAIGYNQKRTTKLLLEGGSGDAAFDFWNGWRRQDDAVA